MDKSISSPVQIYAESGLWTVFWRRHTGKWYKHEEIKPSNVLEELKEEVDKDEIGIFWG